MTMTATTAVQARLAKPADAAAIARIYNEGIEDRIATFETRPHTPQDIVRWLDGVHPVVVCVDGAEVIAFANSSTYRARACYSGVAEFSVYVARSARGRGAGRVALEALVDAAAQNGFWKLIGRILPENDAIRKLVQSVGFREVGTYKRHAKLEGAWHDTLIVEKLIGEAAKP
jgi:L-amino acid N-acyltransferase YncA